MMVDGTGRGRGRSASSNWSFVQEQRSRCETGYVVDKKQSTMVPSEVLEDNCGLDYFFWLMLRIQGCGGLHLLI
jgi:hypothetical protein